MTRSALIGAVLAFISLSLADSEIHVCFKPQEAPKPSKPIPVVCLANAVWQEARGESIEGQRAVLDVIYNRAVQSHTSVCNVVAAPKQFSWYHGAFHPLTTRLKRMLQSVQKHSRVLDSGYTHFFSGDKPDWAEGMECVQIGRMEFCKRGLEPAPDARSSKT